MLKLLFFLTLNFLSLQQMFAGERGSSAPFISGDTFRHYADHAYDELDTSLNPKNVKNRDVVFVKVEYLDGFLKKIHPKINARYVLLTHNSDYPIPGPHASLLEDPKIIAWCGQNTENYSHPKLIAVPIGIANRQWAHGNTDILDKMIGISHLYHRHILLYMNFLSSTNASVRDKVYHQFKNKSFCTKSHLKPYKEYLTDLAQSRFVLSPRGNGLDCHRTWEAMLMGAIPIVQRSALDPVYEGLPVLIIDSWNEITEEFLEEKWIEMSEKSYRLERLYIHYWLEVIWNLD